MRVSFTLKVDLPEQPDRTLKAVVDAMLDACARLGIDPETATVNMWDLRAGGAGTIYIEAPIPPAPLSSM